MNVLSHTGRIEYLDIAKAVAMIFVVVGHVMLYDLYGFEYITKSELNDLVTSYHMPLFIFLSGMFSKTQIEFKDIPYDIYKRFRSLIVPAIVVGIPFTYMLGLSCVSFFIDGMKRGYWYLFTLFELLCFNYLFCLSYKNQRVIKLLYVVSLVGWVWYYRHLYLIPQDVRCLLCMDEFAKIFPFFILGNAVKRYDLDNKLFNNQALFVSVFIVIISSFITIQYNQLLSITLDYDFIIAYHILQNIQVYLGILLTFAKVLCTICVCKILSGIGGHNVIANIGRSTLFIYIFHYYALTWISVPSLHQWFSHNGNFFIDILSSIIPTCFAIIISIGVMKFIKRNPRLLKLVFYQ